MARIKVTDSAYGDIRDVLAFTYERFGKHKLDDYAALIAEAQQYLAQRPQAGKLRPDILVDVRAFPIGQPGRRARHLFLYRLLDDEAVVEILALVYDGMNLANWHR